MASVYAMLSEFPGAKQVANAHLTRFTNLLSEASKGRYGKETAITFRDAARTSIGSNMPAKSLELKHTIKLIRELTSEIDEIENGIVFDHIAAGKGMEVYNTLRLDKLKCQVAIIQNAKSEKMGAKDIIKINELIDINLDVLCYIDKNITVNVIKNGKSVEKKTLSLPKTLTNVIKCSNPRCICNNEDIDHIFTLTDDIGTYRCLYCETKAK